MPRIRAVICTNDLCRYRYHMDLDIGSTVPGCPCCGRSGETIVTPRDRFVRMGPGNYRRIWKIRLPLLRHPMNLSFLQMSADDLARMHHAATTAGYTLIGFHGTSGAYAEDMMNQLREENNAAAEARGRGLYVGSKYTGIPTEWSIKTKGGGGRAILRVYAKAWPWRENIDFEWGKMEPDNDPEVHGLEMVVRWHRIRDLLVMPCAGQTDQYLIPPTLWEKCPTHAWRQENIPEALAFMKYMDMTCLGELEKFTVENPALSKQLLAQMKAGIPRSAPTTSATASSSSSSSSSWPSSAPLLPPGGSDSSSWGSSSSSSSSTGSSGSSSSGSRFP